MDEEAAHRARELRRREDLLAALRLETRLQQANPPPPARAEEERQMRYDRIARILHEVDAGDPDVAYVDDVTAGLLRAELVRLERAGAPPPEDGDRVAPLFAVERSNTILYCEHWAPTVRFYRDDLGLRVVAENDWYVEFRITSVSSLSIADASRTTIDHVGGQGVTISWRVADIAVTRNRLLDRSLAPSEIHIVWNAAAFYILDPEGHRIEIWSEDLPEAS